MLRTLLYIISFTTLLSVAHAVTVAGGAPHAATRDATAADDDTLATADITVADSIITDTLLMDSIAEDTIPSLTVQERIDHLLEADMFQTSQVGIMAYDLTADTVIYARNERQTLRPASTMKLLTAIAALDRLGGSYRYATSLRLRGTLHDADVADGEQNEGKRQVFVGDIIAVGGMDPRFGTDDMRAFAEAISRENIDTIYGTLVADRSFKSADLLGEGWCWDDKNPVLTPLPWSRKDAFIPRLASAIADAGITLLPLSAMPKDSLGQDLYAQRPVVQRTICTRYHSIDQILVRMMKESDNLYAESMFYQLAASEAKGTATARHAANAMKRLIRSLKLDPSRYRIADGSGLSLYNYQTAELQNALLRYAYENTNIYGHLYPSLPIAGKDGTLKKRMRKAPTLGNVHAKTGTLSGISSLSGYLTAKNGNTVCFSIINQGVMHAANAKSFQDKVCTLLCEYK